MANISDTAAIELTKKLLNGDPTQAIIHFDPDTHTYTVAGEVKRSVTQTLKDAGIVGDYLGIDDYYRERGTLVHHYCVLLAQQWLDWDDVRDDCLPFVRTFERIVWELGLIYVSAEQPCYDEEFDVCGSYDLIMSKGTAFSDVDIEILIELKTGDFPMWGGLQLAAYQRMAHVPYVMGISLKDGKIYREADDWEKNHDTLHAIHTGQFDLEVWKANRNRRHMKVLKGVL